MDKRRKVFISILAILVVSFLTAIYITNQAHETKVTGNVIDFKGASEQVDEIKSEKEESSGNRITGEAINNQGNRKELIEKPLVTPEGSPNFIFLDERENSFKIAFCQNDECLNPTIKVLEPSVSSTRRDTLWTISPNRNNFPSLIYLEKNSRQYVLISCEDLLCSSISRNVIKTAPQDYNENHLGAYLLTSGNLGIITQNFGTYETTPHIKDIYSTLLVCENTNCDSNYEVNLGPPYKKENVGMTLNDNGNPVISFIKDKDGSRDDQILVMICGNLDCSRGNTQMSLANIPYTSKNNERKTKVFVGSDNLPIIFYNSNSEIFAVKCKDELCNSYSSEKIIHDATNWDAEQDNLGLVIVSYSSSFGISTVYCNSLDCSSTKKSSIVSAKRGTYNSISIGKDGNPTITFYNNNGNLMSAHCGNPDCTQNNLIRTIVPAENAGRSPRGMFI